MVCVLNILQKMLYSSIVATMIWMTPTDLVVQVIRSGDEAGNFLRVDGFYFEQTMAKIVTRLQLSCG